MMAVAALFVFGAGVTAAGMLWSGLYDIGILVLIVAAIGVVVRIGDWARVLLASPRGDSYGQPASRAGRDAGGLR
jgi:hypothetical protein